jgi:hypothetical protein
VNPAAPSTDQQRASTGCGLGGLGIGYVDPDRFPASRGLCPDQFFGHVDHGRRVQHGDPLSLRTDQPGELRQCAGTDQHRVRALGPDLDPGELSHRRRP